MPELRLRVVDLETTGFEPPAGVCEVGWADVVSTTRDLAGEASGWTVTGRFGSLLANPGCPIPPETSAVHHIIDEDVEAYVPWPEVIACIVHPTVEVYVAHSAKFERLWMTDEVTGGKPWICTYKCALRLWPEAPSHSNQALRYWRRPVGLDRTIAHVAHRAGPDAYVTAFHLRDMLEIASLEQLIVWSAEPALQVRCHIGKWRGTPWREVDDGFLRWVSERDFDEDVLFTVRHEMQRRQDEWEAEQRTRGETADEPF